MASARDKLPMLHGLLAVGLLLTMAAYPARSAPDAASAGAAASTGPRLADLAADARLERRVTVKIKSRPLEEALETLSGKGIRLRTTSELAPRRVTCLAANARVRDLMQAVADVFRFSWRIPGGGVGEGGSAAVYELFQTRAQREWEQAQRQKSAARMQWAHATQKRFLTDAVRQAARQGGAAGEIGDVLATLTPAQIEAIGDIAPMPQGLMVADTMEHTHDRLVGLRPFSTLPPRTRSRLEARIGALRGRPAGPGEEGGLAGRFVGVYVFNAGVCLAVLDASGEDVWLCTEASVRRRGLPGIDSDDDTDPEFHDAVVNAFPGALVALNGLERRSRSDRLRFAQLKVRHRLPEVLESIADQTGLAFVSDDYLRSRSTRFRWVLTDRDEYPLTDALLQIARAFGHSFEGKGGVIRVRTLTPGMDLRGELPPPIVTRVEELHRKKLRPTWRDHLLLGALTDFQWETLLSYGGELAPAGLDLARMYRVRHWVRPYLSLARREQETAESARGLDLTGLPSHRRYAFWYLLNVGIGARRSAPGDIVPAAFSLTRTPLAGTKEKRAVITLRLTGRPGAVVTESIEVAEASKSE